ncbi:MAG: helix-turn-helix transcriptional regulator [Verrucomicrobiota bacterium]
MKSTEIDLPKLAALVVQRRGRRTYRDIAAEIGNVSSPTLSRIEKGNLPDLETFMKLCRWLGASPEDFQNNVGEGEVLYSLDNQEKVCAYLRADRTLPPETAKALTTMIQLAYREATSGSLERK